MTIYEQIDVFVTKLGEMRALAEQIKNPEARAALLEEWARIESQTQKLRTRIPDALRKPEPEVEVPVAAVEKAVEMLPPVVPSTPVPLATQVGGAVAALLGLGRAPVTTRRMDLKDFSAEFHGEVSSTADIAQVAPEPSSAGLPAPVIAGLLQLAQVTSKDLIYHLGCIDGRVLISAASRFQAKGLGLNTQAAAIDLARENVRKARLQALISVKVADPRQEDCTRASIVVLSLGAQQNDELSVMLRRQLKPGARIVSHEGTFKNWPADKTVTITDADGKTYHLHLWHMRPAGGPASIGGSGSVWDA